MEAVCANKLQGSARIKEQRRRLRFDMGRSCPEGQRMKMERGGLEPDSYSQDQMSNQFIDSTIHTLKPSLKEGIIHTQSGRHVREDP
jgi:hypothetical protein